jgi:hypothetical protein
VDIPPVSTFLAICHHQIFVSHEHVACARTLSHVIVFPVFMFRPWSVRDVALRPMLASHGRACVPHWRCVSAAPFTSQEDSEKPLRTPHKPNTWLTVMLILVSGPQVSSGVLILTKGPARLASPPGCPLVSLSSEESPCSIRGPVSLAFSPSSSHSHTHTQLLSKPSQATTSSPILK